MVNGMWVESGHWEAPKRLIGGAISDFGRLIGGAISDFGRLIGGAISDYGVNGCTLTD